MSDKKIKFKLVTPERTVFESEIKQATIPTMDGEITILPNHQSYIASLKSGEMMLKEKTEEILLCISGGFIEFHENQLIVLADTAERAEEIDLERAEEARKKAEELQKQKVSMDDGEYARVAAALQKEMARIRVAKKHRSRVVMKID